MGHRIKMAVGSSREMALDVESASVIVLDFFQQCWCIKLKVWWQTMSIEGWAFLSSHWGEILFQQVFDGQAPHFISGKAIETDYDNDMLWRFGESIGIHPKVIAESIFETLGEIRFVMPHLRVIDEDTCLCPAIAYRHNSKLYRIQVKYR